MHPMRSWLVYAAFASGILCCVAADQWRPYNYDETKAGSYTLPDPLVLDNGKRVRDANTWFQQRRPEIFRLFETQMFGRTPKGSIKPRFEIVSTDKNALNGTATRKEIVVHFAESRDDLRMNLLLYVPNARRKPVPVFLGLNFTGNHTIDRDAGISLKEIWVRDPADPNKMIRRVPDAGARGTAAGRWQVEKILSRGYALATADYCDIEPDFVGGMQYGLRPLFFRAGQTEPAVDEWGAIGAWAWGLSRAADYLETDPDIDAKKIALMGHSRLGKTALWAGAQDQRFAIVISNDSGEGGAALSKRDFGETIEHLNVVFPHWFCANYKQYNNHPERLPFDSHMLLALIAPCPLYVASADQDLGSDPKGEFLGAVNAGPVYALLGKQGLGTDQMPPVEHPIMHTIGYHIRTGKHDVTAYDWDQYLTFADMHFGATKR